MRVAAVGLGLRGGLAKVFERLNGVEVIALCDVDESIAKRFDSGGDLRKAFPNAEFTTSFDELLTKKADAILILTPDHLHKDHAIRALKAGFHVYVEKPLATTVADCDDILRVATTAAGKLFVGHNLRYFPFADTLKKVVDSGEIGRVLNIWCRHFINYGGEAYFKDWHSERRNTTSLLLQKGAHDIDLIHWLADSYSDSVVAMGRLAVYDKLPRRLPTEKADFSQFGSPDLWPPEEQRGFSPTIDVEDSSMVLLSLANGVQASYSQAMYTPDACRNYTIIGTRGRIENIGDGPSSEIWVYSDRHAQFGKPTRVIKVPTVDGSHAGADAKIAQDFVDFVRGHSAPRVTPVAARMAVAAGCAATESLRSSFKVEKVAALDEDLAKSFEEGQRGIQ